MGRPAERQLTDKEQKAIENFLASGESSCVYVSVHPDGEERKKTIYPFMLSKMKWYEGFSFRLEYQDFDHLNEFCGMCGHGNGEHFAGCEVFED